MAGPSKRQMGVGLPEDLRVKLEAAAISADVSIAEEIRRRVERTFAEDDIAPATRELTAAIGKFARDVEQETGSAWQNHAGAHAAFARAVMARLRRTLPNGPSTFDSNRNEGGIVTSDDPETIGEVIEHLEFINSRHDVENRLMATKVELLNKKMRLETARQMVLTLVEKLNQRMEEARSLETLGPRALHEEQWSKLEAHISELSARIAQCDMRVHLLEEEDPNLDSSLEELDRSVQRVRNVRGNK